MMAQHCALVRWVSGSCLTLVPWVSGSPTARCFTPPRNGGRFYDDRGATHLPLEPSTLPPSTTMSLRRTKLAMPEPAAAMTCVSGPSPRTHARSSRNSAISVGPSGLRSARPSNILRATRSGWSARMRRAVAFGQRARVRGVGASGLAPCRSQQQQQQRAQPSLRRVAQPRQHEAARGDGQQSAASAESRSTWPWRLPVEAAAGRRDAQLAAQPARGRHEGGVALALARCRPVCRGLGAS